jgi:hypothetical protein
MNNKNEVFYKLEQTLLKEQNKLIKKGLYKDDLKECLEKIFVTLDEYFLDIEVEITNKTTDLIDSNGNIIGWSGICEINNQIYMGDFAINETYTINGKNYKINWLNYFKK